jgi:hypothetical protein
LSIVLLNIIHPAKFQSKGEYQRRIFLFVYSYYDRWVNGEIGVRHELLPLKLQA